MGGAGGGGGRLSALPTWFSTNFHRRSQNGMGGPQPRCAGCLWSADQPPNCWRAAIAVGQRGPFVLLSVGTLVMCGTAAERGDSVLVFGNACGTAVDRFRLCQAARLRACVARCHCSVAGLPTVVLREPDILL